MNERDLERERAILLVEKVQQQRKRAGMGGSGEGRGGERERVATSGRW